MLFAQLITFNSSRHIWKFSKFHLVKAALHRRLFGRHFWNREQTMVATPETYVILRNFYHYTIISPAKLHKRICFLKRQKVHALFAGLSSIWNQMHSLFASHIIETKEIYCAEHEYQPLSTYRSGNAAEMDVVQVF